MESSAAEAQAESELEPRTPTEPNAVTHVPPEPAAGSDLPVTAEGRPDGNRRHESSPSPTTDAPSPSRSSEIRARGVSVADKPERRCGFAEGWIQLTSVLTVNRFIRLFFPTS